MRASEAMVYLPSTKEQSQNFGRMLMEEIHNGELNVLDLVLFDKCFNKSLEYVKKELTQAARAEAEKYGKEAFTYKGMQIQLAENGIKYDYLHCGDPEYLRVAAAAEVANDALKARELFLRSLKEPMTVVDEESGELYTIYPPRRSSTSGIKCEIK